jgi:hypothetical protein
LQPPPASPRSHRLRHAHEREQVSWDPANRRQGSVDRPPGSDITQPGAHRKGEQGRTLLRRSTLCRDGHNLSHQLGSLAFLGKQPANGGGVLHCKRLLASVVGASLGPQDEEPSGTGHVVDRKSSQPSCSVGSGRTTDGGCHVVVECGTHDGVCCETEVFFYRTCFSEVNCVILLIQNKKSIFCNTVNLYTKNH